MRFFPQGLIVTAVVAAALVASCSSGQDTTAPATSAPTTTEESLAPLPPEGPAPPGAIGVSQDGVTTKVDVPAEATESQYGRACHTAKRWFDSQQGEPQSLVETYLKSIQVPESNGPATFNMPWAQLTPSQQAGAIMAAEGAATGQCA